MHVFIQRQLYSYISTIQCSIEIKYLLRMLSIVIVMTNLVIDEQLRQHKEETKSVDTINHTLYCPAVPTVM